MNIICNAYALTAMSPDTEAKVGALMARHVRREGHVARLPLWPNPGVENARAKGPAAWREVVDYVRRHPGATRLQIADALGIAPNTVNNHLTSAQRAGSRFHSEKVLIGGVYHRAYTVAA